MNINEFPCHEIAFTLPLEKDEIVMNMAAMDMSQGPSNGIVFITNLNRILIATKIKDSWNIQELTL